MTSAAAVVPPEPLNALQRLIADVRAKHRLSYQDIADRGRLPRSTVYKLATQRNWLRAPETDSLDRLARGLGLSRSVVREAAADAIGLRKVAVMDEETRVIVGDLGRLTEDQRKQVAALVRAMLEE